MSPTGGMGCDSRKFYVRVSEIISEKKENYALVASWIKRKISFALSNSIYTFLRGS